MFFKVKNYATMQTALDELCTFLTASGIPQELVFDSKLIACELLGNVLKYTDGESGLHSEIKDGYIRLKILSERHFTLPEEIVCSDVLRENGRGLFLVNKLCDGRIASDEEGIKVLLKIEK
jgi:anti-sigma regulatory factor (Ser/Thr protein kinase)